MLQQTNLITRELKQYVNPAKRDILAAFFKTGPGQYGEGDRFLGIVVPHTRLVARAHRDAPLEVAAELLQSPWHECRLCALLLLVERFKRSDEREQRRLYDFYLTQTARINNWDLVDLSAPYIVGGYLKERPQQREVLYRLADSTLLWEQRIAVVATHPLIKNDDFIDIIALSERLLRHPHDLMHKAIGWMLREMGKRNKAVLVGFLEQHADRMPRTMLRYAIEKFPDDERRYFMKR